jgi:hypothetical protein
VSIDRTDLPSSFQTANYEFTGEADKVVLLMLHGAGSRKGYIIIQLYAIDKIFWKASTLEFQNKRIAPKVKVEVAF